MPQDMDRLSRQLGSKCKFTCSNSSRNFILKIQREKLKLIRKADIIFPVN